MQRNGTLGRGDDGVAHIHAHGSAHEGEILSGCYDRRAADLTLRDEHRLGFARGFLRGTHAVGVLLLVAEPQRILDRGGHLDLAVDAAVEERFEAQARRDRHMVAAVGADVQGFGEFPVEQHGSAFIAFGPEILRHLAAREDGVDAGTDVVGDPVHALLSGAALARASCSARDRPSVSELQLRDAQPACRRSTNRITAHSATVVAISR
jgi:hypothetical protein